MGEYVARASFFTSDLAGPFEAKMDGVARFAANRALIRISVDLIFTDPYATSKRNRHTSPQLDAIVADLRRDGPLKVAAARLGQRILNQPEALLHGDLHSGSVMVTQDDTRVIDPEFAFYGPIGFDLGAFFGNLLLSWYSQPGHASHPAGEDRVAYQEWILDQANVFWETFRSRFLDLWVQQGRGDAYPAAMFAQPADAAALKSARNDYVDALYDDMLGYAACKMIRRILGFAHVIDFERIADTDVRGHCEAGALAMSRLLLTHPGQFQSIDDLIDAVPACAGRRTCRANPAAARIGATPRRRCPAGHGAHDLDVLDPRGIHGLRVFREHHEVGQLAHADRALEGFLVGGVGAVERVDANGLLHRDALVAPRFRRSSRCVSPCPECP